MGILNTLSFLLKRPLSQGRKLATLRRFVAWQIGARLVPGPVACPFANDTWLLARPGLSGATGNVYVGLHEFEDMAFVLHILQGGIYSSMSGPTSAPTPYWPPLALALHASLSNRVRPPSPGWSATSASTASPTVPSCTGKPWARGRVKWRSPLMAIPSITSSPIRRPVPEPKP